MLNTWAACVCCGKYQILFAHNIALCIIFDTIPHCLVYIVCVRCIFMSTLWSPSYHWGIATTQTHQQTVAHNLYVWLAVDYRHIFEIFVTEAPQWITIVADRRIVPGTDTAEACITIAIRLRYNDTTTHSTATKVIKITICVRFNCDTTTTKNWRSFLLASNRVELKQARAIRRSRIVVESHKTANVAAPNC